ncbi:MULTISPECIES: ATP-binding protein [unclassified Bradyrhizobium]|uniref:ATP-binding protein n=1 Tax=Bradyrhizobium TaxID=374 RepID=UPI00291620EE|nr:MULTISPECIES: ATP-binding protein [unclassified Bradyrhizobium]
MPTLTVQAAGLQGASVWAWLQVVSNGLIASAFFTIAFVVGTFLRRRWRDVMFRGIVGALATFVAVVGVTRLLAIVDLWVPTSTITDIINVFLGVTSIGIIVIMIKMLPQLLVLPTRITLQKAYAQLEEEIRQRRAAEAMVRRFQEIEANEAQVRQAQKMEAIGQLTGGVAHDFNNILTVITGTIEILADAVKDKPQLAGIAGMISAAAERGADLTRHLLAFSRRQPLQPRATDINALIVEAGRLLRPTLGEQIEIESMLAHDSAPALIDPSQLSTAILNLALNARDAMPDGGKLTLETKNVTLDEHYAQLNRDAKPGSYVMIAVSDTGQGIPAPLLDKVFEPFFTTKDVGKGSGLGLSMVYGFVKQSNGHVKIYSEEGHGTTVKLYLPRAAGLPETPAAEPGRPAVARGDETILIVEDDALVRDYVVAQVRRLGYRTLSASNAADGLTIIDSQERIDLLFTDVIIPGGMNGRQLAIEAEKRRPGLKVLYTSGYTENAIVHHGRLDADVLLLAKPYVSADLARMIRTALEA